MPHPHKKGATIAYTYALSTQKSIERAQLSPMPQEKFVNICANLWLIENHESHEFHESFFSWIRANTLVESVESVWAQIHPQKWNPCGPKMPTNLREISHHQKQNLWDLWDPCEPKKHHKSVDSCEEKRLRGWVGTTSFGAFPWKKLLLSLMVSLFWW